MGLERYKHGHPTDACRDQNVQTPEPQAGQPAARMALSKPISRRKTLKSLASAGAGALLSPHLMPGVRHPSLHIAGRPVELSLTSISPQTLRLSVVAIENGKP